MVVYKKREAVFTLEGINLFNLVPLPKVGVSSAKQFTGALA